MGLYHHALTTPEVTGAVNAAAPHPVRNAEYTRVLGEVLRRPTPVPVPALAPSVLLGEKAARETALVNLRVDLTRPHGPAITFGIPPCTTPSATFSGGIDRVRACWRPGRRRTRTVLAVVTARICAIVRETGRTVGDIGATTNVHEDDSRQACALGDVRGVIGLGTFSVWLLLKSSWSAPG